MNKTIIIYFQNHRGQIPVQTFLDQNPQTKTKAFRIFMYIKEFGINSSIPHLKKLHGTPLWEIRILGKNSSRILYCIPNQEKIILLHAFKKKTKKTPAKEINIALKRFYQTK